MKPEYIHQLRPLACDKDIQIEDCANLPNNAEDTWMANGRWEGKGIQFYNQEDIMGFVFSYLNAFGQAWSDRSDMLFDWPWLQHTEHASNTVLFLNCSPMSGQCPGYSQEEMNALATKLVLAGHHVVRTNDPETSQHSFSLMQIACFSATCKLIIGGASGPMFCTFNTAARNTHRIVLLDPMRLDYGPNVGPIRMAKNAGEAEVILTELNFLP